MRVLVTGIAGFIGSTIAKRHLEQGDRVVGIDSFNDYYDPAQKRKNLNAIWPSLDQMIEADMLSTDLKSLLKDVDVVYHQAGQPGVRKSWGKEFGGYIDNNIAVTQALLEAAKDTPDLSRLVYASSSSIYGDSETYPTSEDHIPAPMSPYGVTKLAAEHLCSLYGRNFGVPTVSLRYFTVYGPGQRPDMAFNKFMKAIANDDAIPVYGDGTQVRDFTYVDDIVEGNLLAGKAALPAATVINLAGGSSVSVNDVIEILSEVTGKNVRVDYVEKLAGDVGRTGGSTDRATSLLGWKPQVSLKDGLRHEWEWIQEGRA